MQHQNEDVLITLPSWGLLCRIILLFSLALLLLGPLLSSLETRLYPFIWQQTASLQQTFQELTGQVGLMPLLF